MSQQTTSQIETKATENISVENNALAAIKDNGFDKWRQLGRIISESGNRLQWDIGDWIVAGQDTYGERRAYREAQSIFTGYLPATLKDFAYVSRHVPSSVRTNDTSWAHHKQVARFPNPDYQKQLLAEATKRKWSLAKFREYVQEKHPQQKKKELREKKQSTAVLQNPAAAVQSVVKKLDEYVNSTLCLTPANKAIFFRSLIAELQDRLTTTEKEFAA